MRTSGILLPISSLPGEWGIGTLGREARKFIDFLQAAGQTYWQILPIGPTGYGDSPYQSFSAFAANPYFIDPQQLCEDGLLTSEELAPFRCSCDTNSIDYGALYNNRPKLLSIAASRLAPTDPEFVKFCTNNNIWLEDYSLFMALKAENDQRSWFNWPDPVRLRQPDALKSASQRLASQVHYWKALQFFFHRQWAALKRYASEHGVSIIGDIPIYVSPDSSDLWASPELFQVDTDRRLTQVAGCPPDAFAADGQLWGNPLYDWNYHCATHYEWWCRRLTHACAVYDVVRIDHFRGFESYYSIPACEHTARNGSWRKGPGVDFIHTIHAKLPDAKIIAEDLGYLTPAVKDLLRASGYPGMKILQFAFDSRESGDYMPHNYQINSVVYTGTHDNTTISAWQNEALPKDVKLAQQYMACASGNLGPAFIRTALACVSQTAIIPMQDWLGLGAEARLNTPSTSQGNWKWRMAPDAATPTLAQHIHSLTQLYGRLAQN